MKRRIRCAEEQTYGYEVWFDGCCLHSDYGFESEEEAQEEAELEIDSRLAEPEYDDCTEDDFEIFIQ